MNKYLEEAIKFKVGKFGPEENLTAQDIKEIVDLSLNDKTFSGEHKYIPISKIGVIENLMLLTLQNFDLKEEDMQAIASLKSLSTLQLGSCTIPEMKQTLDFESLDHLIITASSFSKLPLSKMPKFVTIINKEGEELDLNTLPSLDDVEELELLNIPSVVNASRVLNMPNLKTLKVDGSQLDDEDVLKHVDSKVKISHDDEFLFMA